jgi:hypothetical protein
MPVTSGQVTVGTAATLIDTTDVMPWELQVNNNDNTDAVFLGGAAVTTTTGMLVQKLEHQTFPMGPGDRMYAVSTKAGHVLSYVKITQPR